MAEDLDKDKAKEAGGGQPKPPEALTPDQQLRRDEAAGAQAAAAAGGPIEGIKDIADSGQPRIEGGQNTWEPQPFSSDAYNPDQDPLVQRAKVDLDPESLLGKPMSPRTREAIQKVIADRRSDELRRLTTNIDTAATKMDTPHADDLVNIGSEIGGASTEQKQVSEIRMGQATWRNADHDEPVIITGDLGERDGRRYVTIEGSDTGIPLDEIAYPEAEAVIPEPETTALGSEPPAPLAPEPTAVPESTPLTPDTATDVSDEVLADARRGVISEQADEDEWDEMEPDELKEEIKDLNENMKGLQRAITDYRTTPDRAAQYQSRFDSLKSQRREMQKRLKKKTGNTLNSSDDEQRTARESVRNAARETARLSNLPIEDHERELGTATKTVEALKSLLNEERDPVKRKAISDELASARAHETVLKTDFDKKKADAEKKKAEDDAKKQSEDYERLQLENASSGDINERIENLEPSLGLIREQITNIEARLNDPTVTLSDDERAQLESQRAELLPQANELQKKVGELKTAFTKAGRREAETLKPGDKDRFEPMKNITDAEWRKLTAEQRQFHVQELGKAWDKISPTEFNTIRAKIRNGTDLSVEESAKFAKELGNRLMKDGRRGYDMRELARLKVTHPEIHAAALDMYINSKAGEDQVKELFPSNWQKILKFAKGKSWLIALLILLAGGGAVAVGKQFGAFMDDEK